MKISMIPALNVPAARGSKPSAAVNHGIANNTSKSARRRHLANQMEKQSRSTSRLEDAISLDGLELVKSRRNKENARHEHDQLRQLDATFKELDSQKSIEKSVIIHRDENGFGLRVKGQAPVFIEHVHENGAAWRAGVRRLDVISKVNGTSVINRDHKDVVLMFKSCTRFVGLTLLSSVTPTLAAPASSEVIDLASTGRHREPLNFQHSTVGFRSGLEDAAAVHELLIGTIPASDFEHAAGNQYEFDGSSVRGAPSQIHRLKAGARETPTIINDDRNYSHSYARTISSNNFGYSTFVSGASDSTPATPASCRLNQSALFGGQKSTNSASVLSLDEPQVPRRSERISTQISYLSSRNDHPKHPKELAEDDQRRNSGSEDQIENMNFNQDCAHCRGSDNQGADRSGSFYSRCQCKLELSNQKSDHSQSLKVFRSLKDPSNPKNTAQQQGKRQQQAKNEAQGGSKSPNKSKLLNRQQTSHDIQCEQLVSPLSKLVQSASTSSLPSDAVVGLNRQPIPGTELNKRTNKRLEILKELVDTERTHTERLRYLDELFYKPLKTGNLMSREQLRQVFSCHRTLYKTHRQIYRVLLSANYNLNEEPMIGSALIEIFEGDLKVKLEKAACTFCSAQSTNVELLNKLTRRDTKTGEFIAQVTSQQMIGRLGIKDLLASCFQRLTKYPLLLENLLKATPKPPNLQEANNTSDRIVKNSSRDSGESNQSFDDDEDEEHQTVEELEKAHNSQRMLAISLEEEREFIERALTQSRQILVRVNEAIRVAMSHNKLKEIWKRTDKYPGVPLIDITKQQVFYEGPLTLRLSKRSFDVYVLLLNNYIIILTREGQDKYRLKFFTPDGKSSSNPQGVYSPVFVIDEHLTTRDAATDENGFYLLCKRKDDSRIYEFASRSPSERIKWRDKIQWTIERQMSATDRRPSCVSTITKSSSEISGKRDMDDSELDLVSSQLSGNNNSSSASSEQKSRGEPKASDPSDDGSGVSTSKSSHGQSPRKEPTKIEGTISYVEDDGIVMPSKMESSRAFVDQAIQVNILGTIRERVTQT